MTQAPTLLLAAFAGLAGAAGAALMLAAQPVAGQRYAHEFHGLVGGLGFGPALDLGRCEFGFDPRLGAGCSCDWGPVPGGVYFCPQHACSVLPVPPLAPTTAEEQEARHALP